MSAAPLPIACDLDAIPAGDLPRYHALRARLLAAAVATTETSEGFSLRFSGEVAGDAGLALLGAWIGYERLCCPFLRFTLDAAPDGALHLAIEGPEGVKAFLRSELAVHTGGPQVPAGALARRGS
jgi:hypothetical protein